MVIPYNSGLKRILPLAVFLLFSGITAVIVNNQIRNHKELVHQHTKTAAEQVSVRLEEFMEARLSGLDIMAERWIQNPDFSKKRFHQFSGLYYNNYPGFQAINWVDPEGIIRWVYPEETNRPAIDMDIHNHPDAKCREVFARVEKFQKSGITPCMDLFQGGQGFAVDIPLIHNGKLIGYLNGVFRVKPLIETCFARGVFDDFWLDIYEGEKLIYQYKSEDSKGENRGWHVEKLIRFRERTWMLKMEPKPRLYSAATLTGNLMLLLFGLLVSIGMALLVYSLIRRVELYRNALEKRRFAEESLIESEERYRTMIENANDMIWILDAKGRLTFFNNQSEIISGHKFEDWKGKSFIPLIHPDDLEMVNEVFRKTLSGKAQHYTVRVNKKSGKFFTLSVNTTPVYAKGKIAGTVSFGRDITGQIRAEEELKRSIDKLKKITEDIIHAMAVAVEMKDPYTAGHQRRVAKLACAIAEEMGLSEKQIEGIRVAAILHDIGKILIPEDILNKPGKLADAEMGRIRAHPKVGSDILKKIEFEWPIADIVFQHHERINRSGYPRQLDGKDILLDGKIVAVADVVEAMCSARPYRPAHSIDEALQEISHNKGILYDPDVVEACMKLFTEEKFKF